MFCILDEQKNHSKEVLTGWFGMQTFVNDN